jgi:hypothetical protein
MLFLSKGTERSSNNESNKIRENILNNIIDLGEYYLEHPDYGVFWTSLREKFISVLSSLCTEEPFKKIEIKHKGGMGNNYDFIVSFLGQLNTVTDVRTKVHSVILEFKHNSSKVEELPQFLELYDKDCTNKYEMCHVSYAEYYYDHFLDEYLKLDAMLVEPKPFKNTYLKYVYDIKYKHPFFANLHNHKNTAISEKRELANKSITSYLQLYLKSFCYDKLVKKIRESQETKVFLLWDLVKFHLEYADFEHMTVASVEYVEGKSYFDLKTDNCKFDIRVRINWGNSMGLCNPRWKLSLRSKS